MTKVIQKFLPEKIEIFRKFAWEKIKICRKFAWKNQHKIFLTQIHDTPRFQTRLILLVPPKEAQLKALLYP